eukprot:scaffold641_cov237-Pinguiococcus_pyrenoidosus.AAC.11
MKPDAFALRADDAPRVQRRVHGFVELRLEEAVPRPHGVAGIHDDHVVEAMALLGNELCRIRMHQRQPATTDSGLRQRLASTPLPDAWRFAHLGSS